MVHSKQHTNNKHKQNEIIKTAHSKQHTNYKQKQNKTIKTKHIAS